MIEVPSLRELMDAGAHFGHKKERSYPKAKQYVYLLKDRVYVINLEKTRELLKDALGKISELAKDGKTIMFVGTKRQASEAIQKAGKDTDMPYVNYRWLGGMLTNFETIKIRLKYLAELQDKLDNGAENLTKREKGKLEEEVQKLHRIFDGIKDMKELPKALFVVDVAKEKNAVEEARKMNIPVIGIADTNANPELIDFPIPANDDAWKTVDLIVGLAANTIKEAKKGVATPAKEEKKDK